MRGYLIVLYVVFNLFLFERVHAQVWHALGNTGFSDGVANYTSLVIDSNGWPIVAFQDGSNSNKATVMKHNGSTWEPLGNKGFSLGAAYYTQLVATRNGVLYLAFQDGGNADKATVLRYNGTQWENVGSPGFSVGPAYYISLAIDGNGVPYVAYQDFADSNKATVMKFNGSDWQVVGMQGLSAAAVAYTCIAINSVGELYVVYEDFAINNRATVMKYDGNAWVTVGIQGFSAGTVNYTAISMDRNDNPHVAFNQSGANVFKYDGSQWLQVGFPQFSGLEAFTAIAFADSGLLYVAGADRENGSKAFVSVYDTTIFQSWSSVGGSASTAGVNYSSLAISKHGVPYLAYADEANGFKATVMEFSVISGLGEASVTQDVQVYPNPSTGIINVMTKKDGYYTLSNSLGQIVKDGKAIANQPAIIDQLPNGFYLLKIGSAVKKVIVTQ